MAVDHQLVAWESCRQEVAEAAEPSKAAVLVAGLPDPEQDLGGVDRDVAVATIGAHRCHPFTHPS